ncbi:MAG: class I tRNA ligase family protein, partial [Oscillospiraceae bacterium]|nr:class I tRNA ligase family protein [Oscillospiraceae bacterium]
TRGELRTLLALLNPFAPHMTEEMWQSLGFGALLAHGDWPAYDEAKCVEDSVEIAVQVNGKVKGRVTVCAGADAATAIAAAKADDKVAAELAGKVVVKELYVPGRLVNIVAKGQ